MRPKAAYISTRTGQQCCGSGMFIPDPNFFHPGSRICVQEFKYFNQKKIFLSSRKHDPGCSSRILIFYQSRIQELKRHRKMDPDLQHCWPASIRQQRYLACLVPRETISYPLLLLLLLLDLGEGEGGDEMLGFGRGRVGEHVGVVVAGWYVHAASAALHLPLLLLLRLLFLQLGFILLRKKTWKIYFSQTGR